MRLISAGHFPWQSFLKKTNKPQCVVWTFWNPTIPLVYHWFPLSIGVSRLWRKHANIFWTSQSFPRKTVYFHSYVIFQQSTSWGTWWCWCMGWNGATHCPSYISWRMTPLWINMSWRMLNPLPNNKKNIETYNKQLKGKHIRQKKRIQKRAPAHVNHVQQDNLRPVIYYLKHMMQDMDEEKMLSRALISYATWRHSDWDRRKMERMVICPGFLIFYIYIYTYIIFYILL